MILHLSAVPSIDTRMLRQKFSVLQKNFAANSDSDLPVSPPAPSPDGPEDAQPSRR
jgi:hypothetical protein